MALSITELLSDEEGQPYLDKSEVRLRVANNDLTGDMAKMSEAKKCQLIVFIELPVGFKSAVRIPDRDQFAVVLNGQLRISAQESEDASLGPGEIFRLPPAASSTHTLEAIGPEAVRLMVLQA